MQRDTGFVSLTLMDEEGEYRLPLSEYDRVLAAWKSGAAFIETTSYFGGALTVKGSRVSTISRITPEHLEALEVHEAEVRADEAIRGDG